MIDPELWLHPELVWYLLALFGALVAGMPWAALVAERTEARARAKRTEGAR